MKGFLIRLSHKKKYATFTFNINFINFVLRLMSVDVLAINIKIAMYKV